MFNPEEFPAFIHQLPEADLPVKNLQGWISRGKTGLLLFLISREEVHLPEHSHGDQWGIVVGGSMELTIGTVTRTMKKGDSYFIPAGVLHHAILHKGFQAIDYFDDPDRYREKSS